jgi:ribonuclease HI
MPETRAHGVADLSEFRNRLADLRANLMPPVSAGEFVASTDGACLGNPDGPGGWAAVIDGPGPIGPAHWELWGSLSSTSNNRAEALGVLGALEWLPARSRLHLRSDSELTIKILLGVYKAKANPDLWLEIRRLLADKAIQVQPEWVRGHAGDPGNELADRLSKLGALGGDAAALSQLQASAAARVPDELVGLAPRGDWETQFLRSIADQLRRGRALSPKQQAQVDRIRARGSSG